MSILSQSIDTASQAPTVKTDDTEWVAGPFPVGEIGQVGVIERESARGTFLYARFVPNSGRPSNLSLAACAVLVGALEDAETAPADAQEEDSPEDE